MDFGSTQSLLIIGTFIAVIIIIIAFDLLDIAVTALLGLCLLLVTGALDDRDLFSALLSGGESLALLLGGMVVARVLTPTGIFDLAGYYFVRAARGSGKRYSRCRPPPRSSVRRSPSLSLPVCTCWQWGAFCNSFR